ncbi:uncharacterized protein LOC114253145 [Bombyx mandarina]|uniref:Uncharacterized protein LOC114253145 n=1 Tax=Bombyx mandarina TaxID=7092 RepID=A0A6J2KNJ3_BOMMA|nr:uncharacterized protein LOC114253145 [Bombyx mandarina]
MVVSTITVHLVFDQPIGEMRFLILFLSVVAVVYCGPVNQDENLARALLEPFVKCQNSDYYLCGKEYVLKAVEKIRTLRTLNIIDGITLLNNNPKESRSLETLSSEPAVRTKQVNEKLWETASEILQSSELELSYGPEVEESRAIDDVEEGRGKKKKLKKKLKMLIPLMILAKAKAIALVVAALLIIAASIFKIALLAKIAFIIKIIAIIKALLAKKHAQEEVSWESHGWEPHADPHAHVEHGHGWEGGWSRSRNEANNMAYSAYKK